MKQRYYAQMNEWSAKGIMHSVVHGLNDTSISSERMNCCEALQMGKLGFHPCENTDLLKPKGFIPCPTRTYIVAYENFLFRFFFIFRRSARI